MADFTVEPQELRDAAARLRASTDELASQPTLRYRTDPDGVGDPVLATALGEFQQGSTDVTRLLHDDTTETAARLTEAAQRYEESDEQARDGVLGR